MQTLAAVAALVQITVQQAPNTLVVLAEKALLLFVTRTPIQQRQQQPEAQQLL
jgi:hypothetical protein